MKTIPVEKVARIAATLLSNSGPSAVGIDSPERIGAESSPLVKATAAAYELLEIASYAQLHLELSDSYEKGLVKYIEGKEQHEDFLRAVAEAPNYEHVLDDEGKKMPFPFDKGLVVLMPKLKEVDRIKRLRDFIADYYDYESGSTPQERMTFAGRLIEKWKTDGIPAKFFDHACVLFPEWWKDRKSAAASQKGRVGQRVKKEKQNIEK